MKNSSSIDYSTFQALISNLEIALQSGTITLPTYIRSFDNLLWSFGWTPEMFLEQIDAAWMSSSVALSKLN